MTQLLSEVQQRRQKSGNADSTRHESLRRKKAHRVRNGLAKQATLTIRMTSVPLSGGNYATIFSAGTWLTETALAGWGDRTRTRKCRFNINASAALDLPGRTN